MRKKRQLKLLFCTKKVGVSVREQYNGFNCMLHTELKLWRRRSCSNNKRLSEKGARSLASRQSAEECAQQLKPCTGMWKSGARAGQVCDRPAMPA